MEKNLFPMVALMPTNRVHGFVKKLPQNVKKHEALVFGMRCREEALAFFLEKDDVDEVKRMYPHNTAVRYVHLTPYGKAKVCLFTMQFEQEPQLYAVWCECSKVVAGLSDEDRKKLNFVLYLDEEQKQVCFLSYDEEGSNVWVQMMLNFVHHIQPDENEWVGSEIIFKSCEIEKNF